EAAADAQELGEDDIAPSLARRSFRANWALPRELREPTLEDVLWARQVADTVVHAVRGVFPNIGPVVDVIQVEDEPDRAWRTPPRAREPFFATLRAMGLSPRAVSGPTPEGRGSVVISVHGEPGAGMSRVGYTESTR